MERKLNWDSHLLDEIELVYEKAEENEVAMEALLRLEEQALAEAAAACAPGGLIAAVADDYLSQEQFDDIPDEDKESAIFMLAERGLAGISSNYDTATINAKLSGNIQQTMACTVFGLLNRLEKLDGAVQMINPNWTLHLEVPLGAKKGLFQWEMLIMQLYPWLSVKETASNIASDDLLASIASESGAVKSTDFRMGASAGNSSDSNSIQFEVESGGSQYGTGTASGNTASGKQADAGATAVKKIVCFLFPMIGIIMAIVDYRNKPKTAKEDLIFAGLGAAFVIIMNVISSTAGAGF